MDKRQLASTILLLLGSMSGFSSWAQSSGEVTARSGINLRVSPQGRKIGALANGTDFTILSRRDNWLRVRLDNGTVGYIWAPAGVDLRSKDATKTVPVPTAVRRDEGKNAIPLPLPRPEVADASGAKAPGATPAATPTAKPVETLHPTDSGNDTNQLVTTARGGLYLRAGPGSGYQPLGKIDFGKPVDPTGREKNGWVEVEIAGRKGWVHGNYVAEGRTCTDGTCNNPHLDTGMNNGFTAWAKQLTDAVGVDTGSGPLPYAKLLQSKLSVGYAAGKNLCWRAVWNDLRAAGLVRGELTQNSAKNALIDLSRHGFRHDPKACNRPGVVRVYDGTSVYVNPRSRTAGDTHGHVEILGTDGKFHHFTRSINSIQSRFGKDRRPLKYCLVKG